VQATRSQTVETGSCTSCKGMAVRASRRRAARPAPSPWPAGAERSQQQLAEMADFGTTAPVSTSSYTLYLGKQAEKMGSRHVHPLLELARELVGRRGCGDNADKLREYGPRKCDCTESLVRKRARC
jgi:hypothetical protein